MSIERGTKLGPYEVLSLIGAGGMGEVYRARDPKLGREVAIKVLPEAFEQDKERLARFEREARLLASLNHPNVATIHELEHSDGVHFLVMELVPGKTLAEQVMDGPVPINEALPLLMQIAEALEAAHGKGIIHRDLKPANIKVTPEGNVKVLDFGLAKAYTGDASDPSSADLSQSPTLSRQATAAGVILGTAAYMSPEQAKGKATDHRTDIWAYGCVLYEMLTGKKAFEGEDVSETLAAVLRAEPEWSALPAATPSSIERLVRRCLKKDRIARLQHIGDARLEIDDAAKTAAVESSRSVETPYWQKPLLLALAASLLMALTAVVVWNLMRPPEPRVARFVISPAPTEPLLLNPNHPDLAISPNGTDVVYRVQAEGEDSLCLRRVDRFDATPFRDLGSDPRGQFVSHDGYWTGFFTDGALKKVPIEGGPSVTLCPVNGNLRGASWSSDNTIIFATAVRDSGLFRVSAVGGEPELLTIPKNEKGELDHRWPQFLPGGRAVLFEVERDGPIENSSIAVLSLDSGEQKVLLTGGSYPRYSPTGHLVYAGASSLWAVGFDLDRLEITGNPVPVLENVLTKESGAASFDFSSDGTLVYLPGDVIKNRQLVWVDRQGREEPLGAEQRTYIHVALSPDGTRVAATVADAANTDIWIYDVERGTSTRFTFDPAEDRYPIWTTNGRRIVFRRDRGQGALLWKLADGTGPAEALLSTAEGIFPYAFSPDGRLLAFTQYNPETDADIHLLSFQDEPTSRPLIQEPFVQTGPSISPDGRWLAYQSRESGRQEVYVRPFPNVDEGKWQISTTGGRNPLWGPDSRELFYRGDDVLMVVPLDTEPALAPGQPTTLFQDRYWRQSGPNYSLSPDGQRFLMIKGVFPSEAASPQIHVVLNWFEELKRLAPID